MKQREACKRIQILRRDREAILKTARSYTRRSKTDGSDISLEVQTEKILLMAQIKNHTIGATYSDLKSGKNLKRRGFESMMKDVRADLVSAIYVYKLDRLGRSFVELVELLEEFDKRGVEFISVSENFDTSTPHGRAFMRTIMAFAAMERELISERTSDALQWRLKKGHILMGARRFGEVYKSSGPPKDRRQWAEPNPPELKYIEFAKKLRAEGLSLRQIGMRLELEMGLRPRIHPVREGFKRRYPGWDKFAEWDARTVSNMVKRPLRVAVAEPEKKAEGA
jgi:DNA invertase Pin-like site-specific DNA recombinase